MANNFKGLVLMPEVILYKSIKSIFNIIKEDYIAVTDKEDSMLYSFFGKDEQDEVMAFEEFNYFEQAVETFINKTPQVNLGYNLEVAHMGCIHILLPSENGQVLSIGADEGYQGYQETDTEFKEIYTQRFDTTYNMLITSENTFETILIYNILKSSILALNYHFELMGLRLPKVSGGDLNVQSDLVPTHIFHRSLMMNFFYELSVPNFFYKTLIKNFKITGIIEDKDLKL